MSQDPPREERIALAEEFHERYAISVPHALGFIHALLHHDWSVEAIRDAAEQRYGDTEEGGA